MIKIDVVCVGKIKEEFYRAAMDEYLKRLSRFAKVEVKEITEGKNLEEEGANILRAAKGKLIALCIEGKKFSSEELAGYVKSLCDGGEMFAFIIGSSHGLSEAVKKAAHLKLSFSDMTFPHQLMRVILAEQLYRSFMINGGGEYHK